MKELTDAEKRWHQADSKFFDLRSKVQRLRDEKIWKFTEAVDAELEEEFGEELSRLEKARSIAKSAMLAEREREAVKDLPHPVGTKLCRWVDVYRYCCHIPCWKMQGHAVVEICTRETVHSPRSSKAIVGERIYRHLKKDGTPSKRYSIQKLGEKFLPEGVDPNKKKGK